MSQRFAHLPNSPEEVTVWRLKMPVAEIGYLNCIYEAHEGVCLVNTTDKRQGLVEITVMPAFEEEFLTVLNDLLEPCQITILEKGLPYHAKPRA